VSITNIFEREFGVLRAHAQRAVGRAYAPYSGRPKAAVLLLSDGAWVPGVRVESATFSLVIPALLNAATTAVAVGRTDVVAAVLSRPAAPHHAAYLGALPFPMVPARPDAFVREGLPALPEPGTELPPFLDAPLPRDEAAGLDLARAVAKRAYVPFSDFPVGCVLETDDGRLIPGVNVEHPDWSRILCAERNALGTAVSYGVGGLRRLYLACPRDAHGTPCGACRQLLAEQASGLTLWLDRHTEAPERTTPATLLPAFFKGETLGRTS
jgi:homotetrameric cytidine deaminase